MPIKQERLLTLLDHSEFCELRFEVLQALAKEQQKQVDDIVTQAQLTQDIEQLRSLLLNDLYGHYYINLEMAIFDSVTPLKIRINMEKERQHFDLTTKRNEYIKNYQKRRKYNEALPTTRETLKTVKENMRLEHELRQKRNAIETQRQREIEAYVETMPEFREFESEPEQNRDDSIPSLSDLLPGVKK